MNEADLLARVRERFRTTDPDVLLGCGPDDCAHVRLGAETLALTTDTLVAGIHYGDDASPRDVGWKAIASCLSDLAASGCRARWALVAATLADGIAPAWIDGLLDGMAECANRCNCRIVGGDTTRGAERTVLTVTAAGTPYPGGPLARSGAQSGDALLVTGALGGSLARRHLHPEPRFSEIETALKQSTVHACMDISDGLALDLHRLLKESGVGAEIRAADIPVSADAEAMAAQSGRTPLDHALGDGEDFELLLAVPEEKAVHLLSEWPATGMASLSRIGTVLAETGAWIVMNNGQRAPLPPKGYLHAFD